MFRSLLVPLDGALVSETVLPTAAFVAKQAKARVTLLHLVERHAPVSVHGQRHLTSSEEAEAYLREVAGRCFPPDVVVTWHVHRRQTADVARSLADHAEELEADLVIMLAHGRKPFHHWWSGAVAQQAVRQSPVPILVVQAGPDGTVGAPFRQVLVPLDGRREHEAGLGPAAELARLAAAPVHLLTVVPTYSTLQAEEAATAQLLPAATREVLDLAEQDAVQYLQKHVESMQAMGLAASATVVRGEPAEEIVAMAARLGADLVVLGTHGASGMGAFWSGSLGQKLLHRIAASFVLAPAYGPA